MQFLLNHWHCILPVIGIVVAVFLMQKKPKKNSDSDNGTQREDMKGIESSHKFGGK